MELLEWLDTIALNVVGGVLSQLLIPPAPPRFVRPTSGVLELLGGGGEGGDRHGELSAEPSMRDIRPVRGESSGFGVEFISFGGESTGFCGESTDFCGESTGLGIELSDFGDESIGIDGGSDFINGGSDLSSAVSSGSDGVSRISGLLKRW